MITINVKIHAHYVQSSVRFYHSPLSYVELGTGDVTAPLKTVNTQSACDLRTLYCTDLLKDLAWPDVWQHGNSPALPEFTGVFEIQLLINEDEDFELIVDRAVHIDASKGNRNVTAAFKFESLRLAMLKNLFSAVAYKDVEKLETVLKAIRTAAGVYE